MVLLLFYNIYRENILFPNNIFLRQMCNGQNYVGAKNILYTFNLFSVAEDSFFLENIW